MDVPRYEAKEMNVPGCYGVYDTWKESWAFSRRGAILPYLTTDKGKVQEAVNVLNGKVSDD